MGEGFCPDPTSHVDIGTVIEWSHNPPHSGPHYPIWDSWDEHDTPVERGYWVHNLEHGGIVLLYNCVEACDADLELLRALMDARPELKMLMTEDPLLETTRFAALTWTWTLETDTLDLDELLCFVDQHYDHAPESVL